MGRGTRQDVGIAECNDDWAHNFDPNQLALNFSRATLGHLSGIQSPAVQYQLFVPIPLIINIIFYHLKI
ncbi:ATP-dependent DNA helicase [Dirofilaria immitis]